MRRLHALAIAVLFCCAMSAVADTNVSGTIATTTTWTLANSPYVVTGAITVNSGVTLTIEAGVTVKFNGGQYLDVNGTLVANGTTPAPITFTSSAATPTAGSWLAVHFKPGSSSSSQLTYASVLYSGGWNAGVAVESSSPTIDHVTVSSSSSDGIKVMGTGSAPTITNCTLSSNAGYGVNVTAGNAASIGASTFTNNNNYAIGAEANTNLSDLTNLTATGNGSGGTKNAIGYRGGTISTAEHWITSALWREVTSSVTVNSGVTLTIDAAATIKFANGQYLDIAGTLIANGTSAAPITFSSSSATPTAGSWLAVHFKPGSSSSSQLTYASVLYSGGWNAGVVVEGSSPTIDHVTVSNSSSDGIKVMGTGSAPTITNCTLTSNSSNGLNLTAGNSTVTGCTMSSNSGYGLNITSGTTATISSCTFTNNGNYATGADTNTSLLDLSNLTATGNGSGGTKNAIGYRGGSISGAERWVNGSLPREVTSSTTVNSGVTLTIDPGATIKFANGQYIAINGTLLATGTSAAPITFTSNAATPTAGSWSGVQFKPGSSSNSQLAYASVLYSGGWVGGVVVEGSSPTIDHVTVSNSSTDGIKVMGTSPAPTLTNCTISSNSGYGINLIGGTTATISGCTFTSNGNYAIGAEANANLLDLSNLTATGNGSGGTKNAIGYRGGSISGAERWVNGSLPREVTSGTTVNSGVTLTIDPGATIKFANGQYIAINGTLLATGTSASLITFTSNAATPTAGSWSGVQFKPGSSSSSQLTYSSVLYSGGWVGGVVVEGSSPTIDHVAVSNSSTDGIKVMGTSPAPTITNGTISSNSGYGINLIGGTTATISGCTFTSNGNYAIGAEANTNLVDLSNINATGNGAGGTKNAIEYRGGSIGAAERWINGSLSREVTSSVTVNTGVTLTIDPGATIKFAGGKGIEVYGSLLANGTAASPILFTSNAASPAAGAWNCIHYHTGSTASLMTYATITYSGGYQAGLVFDGGNPSFDHVTISNSSGGVRVNSGAPSLHNCAFLNTVSGVTNNGTDQVDAKLCYWGAADGPSNIGRGTGLSVSWNVAFDPWLTAAPSAPECTNAATVQTRTFNPSLSAYPTITPTFALTGNWSLTILNSAQTVLRTYSGSGQTASVTWDGKDSNGTTQAAGTYTYKIDCTASTGEVGTTARGVLLLTSASYQPSLTITAPSNGQTLSNIYGNTVNFSVVGSAADPNLNNWTFDYGVGANPSTWTVINTGTTNVQNAQLGAIAFGNGSYTLRLQSWDTYGNYSLFTEPVNVANFSASQNSHELNQANSGTVTYTSNVPFTLTETIVLKNEAGQVIRTLFSGARNAGTYTDTWDGHGDAGALLQDGPYFFVTTVTDGTHTLTYDLTNQFLQGFDSMYPTMSSTFDPYHGQPLSITYTFPQPGRVTIVFTNKSDAQPCGPNDYCWKRDEWQSSGTHTVYWYGTDDTGTLRPDLNRVAVASFRTNFAQNAVLVFGAAPAAGNASVSAPADRLSRPFKLLT